MSEELTWLSAWQIRELVAKREVSPVEVVEHFLGRIEEHDPTLNAFKTLDRTGAHEQAVQAEAALVAGDDVGPLHGVPIAVKEHIPVAGLPMLGLGGAPDALARRDAIGVSRLRNAGAIILGTNTMMGTSGSMADPAHRVYNWGKEARNPWDTDRVPGWSSSGGAAAVAAGLLPLAIGSDGGGSTRLPAAYSGVVGLHPTGALIPTVDYGEPRLGVLGSVMGSIGPLCRDVRDAAITLQAMAGPDGRDFISLPFEPPDYSAGLDLGVDGMRFAWTDDYGFTSMYAQSDSTRIIETVRQSAMAMASLGAAVEVTEQEWVDFWPGYVASSPVVGGAVARDFPSEEEWGRALDSRQRNWTSFRQVLAEHDVILSVTAQLLPRTVEEWDHGWTQGGDVYPHGTFAPTYTSHTHMYNWLSFPAISVPCGFVDGLPVGLQIGGLPGSEDKILRVANTFLKAFPRDEHPPVS